MSKLVELVENHRLIRRVFLILSGLLTGWTTYQVFRDVSAITAAAAAAYGTQYALAMWLARYYFKQREDEGK